MVREREVDPRPVQVFGRSNEAVFSGSHCFMLCSSRNV